MAATSDSVEIRLGGLVDRRAVADRIAARLAARDGTVAPAPERPEPRLPVTPAAPAPGGEMVAFSPVRARTAAHLRRSLDTTAQALLVVEVDYGAVEQVRTAAGLTYLPFVARAVVEAARAFPRVNGTSAEGGVVLSSRVNLGIAVDLAFEGLVVPVVHDAGAFRLDALAARIDDVAGRAHAGKLTMADLEGGTFTITNVGSYGTVSAVPIINHPQVAILSTDGVRMRPVAMPGGDGEWQLAVRPVGNLSMAFDHRIFDGAYAAAFLSRVRHELESRDWQAER